MSKNINIIVSGHGNFATGIKSTLGLLTKIPDNFYFVDFTEGMTDKQLAEQYQEILKQHPDAEFIFFTDLLGGTPYKTSVVISVERDNCEVVVGCNVGSLLESIYGNYSNAKDYADALVQTSKDSISRFVDEPSSSTTNDEPSDGI